MIKIKTSYDDETDVPDAYRELYEEQGGKWVLTGVEGMKTERDIAALKLVADKERKARADADAKVKKFEKLADKDPDVLLAAIDDLEAARAQIEELEAAAGGGKGKPADEEVTARRIETAVKKATSPLLRQITESQKLIDAAKKEAEEHKAQAAMLDGKIRRSSIESELTRQAAALKVRPEAVADVLALAAVFDLDEGGQVRTRDGVGFAPNLDVATWLADMKATRPHWWPESIGGGARDSSGKPLSSNPFDKRSPNLSKIGALMKADPAKATQMAAAAGFSSVDAAVRAMADAAVAHR